MNGKAPRTLDPVGSWMVDQDVVYDPELSRALEYAGENSTYASR